MKRTISLILLLGIMSPLCALALGWSPQLARAAIGAINGFTGNFTLGGGLSVNTPFVGPEGVLPSPWLPYPQNNVILQTTGTQNVLRNASLTSWQHYKFMTQDGSVPYVIGIASYTGVISGTTLSASSVTGTLQPFQRVTDAVTLTTNGTTAVGNNTLHFASTTGIVAGMYVDDITTPRAIAGNLTVASTTGTTVVLSGNVGFYDNTQMQVAPGVGGTDVIAFSKVKRGTSIVRQINGTPGGAGDYQVTVSQTISSPETMLSEGGWAAEGVYVIARGTAGTSSVTCNPNSGGVGSFNPVSLQCTATGTLTDLILRFPLDYIDAAHVNCATFSGAALNCVNSNHLLQPITFQLAVTYGADITTAPYIISKNACPLDPANPAGTNICSDVWTNATTDMVSGALPVCHEIASPIECPYAYTWLPTGIYGNMEVEFHFGALTNAQYFAVESMELKQTPGATCNGTAPPCFQITPGPIEFPEAVADINHNLRFTQTIGQGWGLAWNAGNVGPIETTPGFAYSTTLFISSWPLPATLRCDVWVPQHTAPTCPPPNVYIQNETDYIFNVAGGGQFATSASGLTTAKLGLNSIQLFAVSSGMTAGQTGFVTWGTGNHDMIMLDSAIIGD